MSDNLNAPVAPAPGKKQIMPWLNVLRLLCAFEILGFHWLRAADKVGILSDHKFPDVIAAYKDTGFGLAGFELPWHEYRLPGIYHAFSSLYAWVFGYGWGAINVFIVISGFALALNYPDKQPVRALASWYSRRLKRILLPYYAVAGLYITAFLLLLKVHVHSGIVERFQSKLGSLFDGSTEHTILIHLFLLDPSRPLWVAKFFSPAWWFIPAILFAYVCFPLYISAFRRMGRTTFLVLALAVSVSSDYLTARHYLVDNGWYFITLNECFSLALGIVGGSIWRSAPEREALSRRLARPSTALAAAFLFIGGNVLNWFHATYPLSSPCFTFGLSILGMQISMYLAKWRFARAVASVDAFTLYLLHQPLAFPLAVLLVIPLGARATVLGLPLYAAACYGVVLLIDLSKLRRRSAINSLRLRTSRSLGRTVGVPQRANGLAAMHIRDEAAQTPVQVLEHNT